MGRAGGDGIHSIGWMVPFLVQRRGEVTGEFGVRNGEGC